MYWQQKAIDGKAAGVVFLYDERIPYGDQGFASTRLANNNMIYLYALSCTDCLFCCFLLIGLNWTIILLTAWPLLPLF